MNDSGRMDAVVSRTERLRRDRGARAGMQRRLKGDVEEVARHGLSTGDDIDPDEKAM